MRTLSEAHQFLVRTKVLLVPRCNHEYRAVIMSACTQNRDALRMYDDVEE